jgi:hypothetical protein
MSLWDFGPGRAGCGRSGPGTVDVARLGVGDAEQRPARRVGRR